MLKKALQKTLGLLGKDIVSSKELQLYRSLDSSLIFYNQLDYKLKKAISTLLPYSKSQLAQDLFAVVSNIDDPEGFFVEFGATDGVTLSNSWLLEKKLGWNGILVEPAKCWHETLLNTRDCSISTKCVAGKSGQICNFVEASNLGYSSRELSTVEKYSQNSAWSKHIKKSKPIMYPVETICLGDLLDQYNAPETIQFMSIDTEGSELDILSSFDFSSRNIKSICVEHNYIKKNREMIEILLASNGYTKVYSEISRWDDWYIR